MKEKCILRLTKAIVEIEKKITEHKILSSSENCRKANAYYSNEQMYLEFLLHTNAILDNLGCGIIMLQFYVV